MSGVNTDGEGSSDDEEETDYVSTAEEESDVDEDGNAIFKDKDKVLESNRTVVVRPLDQPVPLFKCRRHGLWHLMPRLIWCETTHPARRKRSSQKHPMRDFTPVRRRGVQISAFWCE